jgi:hypothetical protein
MFKFVKNVLSVCGLLSIFSLCSLGGIFTYLVWKGDDDKYIDWLVSCYEKEIR